MASNYETEKVDNAAHDENERAATQSPDSLVDEFDAHKENKLMRKIDWRLLPILGALYSIALIDRVNVSQPIYDAQNI